MRTISSSSPDAPAISGDHYAAVAEVDRLGLSELPPAIFEKDLLITKILGLLKTFNWGQFAIVFCGGTALSKGHKLIQRMSEDVDFKILVPSSPKPQPVPQQAKRATQRFGRTPERGRLQPKPIVGW